MADATLRIMEMAVLLVARHFGGLVLTEEPLSECIFLFGVVDMLLYYF